MKIIAVTPFWKRLHISKIYWQGIEDLRDSVDISVVAICSDYHNEQLAARHTDRIMRYKNNPLGEKWNKGIESLLHDDFDYCLIIGSDDICSPRLFSDVYADSIKKKINYIGLTDAVAINYITKGYRYFPGYANHRIKEPIGAGRLISKRALKQCNYVIFPQTRDAGMDRYMHTRMIAARFDWKSIKTGFVPYRIGVKSSETISKSSGSFSKKLSLDGFYSKKLIELIYDSPLR